MERIDKLGIIFLAIVGFLAFVTFILYPLIPLFFGLEGREPPYCEYGDVNGDGLVARNDITYEPKTWDEIERGDVDNDGDFDAVDKALIYNYAIGGNVVFPVANKSSPYYQKDIPPYVESMSGGVLGYVGEEIALEAKVNDTNGEMLIAYLVIYKDGNRFYEFPERTVKPGQWIVETYTFPYAGEYQLYCFVRYKYRYIPWQSDYIDITIKPQGPPNQPPVANAGGPYYAKVNEPILIDGSNSYDPDGHIVKFEWDLYGDGIYDYFSDKFYLTLPTEGEYDLILRVTDNSGLSDTDETKIYVGYTPPSGKPVADFNYAIDGLTVTFYDASYDPDGYIVNWTWDFGDGKTDEGQIVSHTYSKAGTYYVTLTVTDNDGNTASKTLAVTVEEKGFSWWWIAGGIGFISVVGILYMRRRRKK